MAGSRLLEALPCQARREPAVEVRPPASSLTLHNWGILRRKPTDGAGLSNMMAHGVIKNAPRRIGYVRLLKKLARGHQTLSASIVQRSRPLSPQVRKADDDPGARVVSFQSSWQFRSQFRPQLSSQLTVRSSEPKVQFSSAQPSSHSSSALSSLRRSAQLNSQFSSS